MIEANGTAKAQLQVQFPVASTSGSSLPIPQTNAGLWARSFSTSAIAYANVLDSSGCTSGNTAFSSSVGNLPSLPVGSMPNGNQTPNLSSTAATITQKVIPFFPLPTYPSSFTALVTAHKVNELANWAFFLYSPTATLGMQGTSDIYAFIFAPYASASMGGNPKIAGGLWVKSFSTNGTHPKIFQATSQGDINRIFTNAYTASGDDITSANTMGPVTAFCKTDATLASPPPAPIN